MMMMIVVIIIIIIIIIIIMYERKLENFHEEKRWCDDVNMTVTFSLCGSFLVFLCLASRVG